MFNFIGIFIKKEKQIFVIGVRGYILAPVVGSNLIKFTCSVANRQINFAEFHGYKEFLNASTIL